MEGQISLYEMNRSIIEQQGPLEEGYILDKLELIREFVENTENKYYMLYGKEIGYFTVFVQDYADWHFQDIAIALTECFINIGIVYSIEYTETQDAIEIWIKATNEDILTCFYFFPYDGGIVKFEGCN